MLFSGLSIPVLLSRLVTLVIAFTVHEFSHAWLADRFGDPLPRYEGRVTLNPRVHLDIVGSLMLLISGFGWAKPVQISPGILQRVSRAAPMLVALAGPFSNLLLAALAAVPVRLGVIPSMQPGAILPTPAEFLFVFIVTNIFLMLLNLIPLAPLDGASVAWYVFPSAWLPALEKIQRNGPVILIALLLLLPYLGLDIVGWVFRPVSNFIFRLLTGVQL